MTATAPAAAAAAAPAAGATYDPFASPAAAAEPAKPKEDLLGGLDFFAPRATTPTKVATAAPAAAATVPPAEAPKKTEYLSPGDMMMQHKMRRDSASKAHTPTGSAQSTPSGSPVQAGRRLSVTATGAGAGSGGATLAVPGAGEGGTRSRSSSGSAGAGGAAAAGAAGAAKTDDVLAVDVLAYMKKGTPFLKYGSYGYPHFRQFQLSDDNTKIMWFSKAKKLTDSQIDIFTVDELRLGQTTPNFAKHKAPELARSSFSLIYNNGAKTLDVIAKDPNDFRIWTTGLSKLIELAKDPKSSIETMKNLVVPLHVVKGRRSSVDVVDAKTGKTAESLPGTVEDEKKKASSHQGEKVDFREIAEGFNELKYKLAKYTEQTRDLTTHAAWPSIHSTIKRCEASVEKIAKWYQDGDYALCDDEIWRAGVDLDALKNMIAAIHHG